MAPKSIDALAGRFMTLAKKPKLAKSERNEARQCMVALKQEGLSNEEISELSGGRWAPNSIKHYTKGIPSPSTQCDSVVQLLQNLNAYGLTLGDVEKTVETYEGLKSHDIPLESITDVLFAAECSSMDIADLMHQYQLIQVGHGLIDTSFKSHDQLDHVSLRGLHGRRGLDITPEHFLVAQSMAPASICWSAILRLFRQFFISLI